MWAACGPTWARPQDHALLPYGNGGLVSLRSSGNIKLDAGSGVILDSGAAVLAGGKRRAGKGGDAVFEAGAGPAVAVGALDLSGAISALGRTAAARCASRASACASSRRGPRDRTRTLPGRCCGTTCSAWALPATKSPASANLKWRKTPPCASSCRCCATPIRRPARWRRAGLTPPLYQDDAVKAELTQRKGAGLSLAAGVQASNLAAARATVLNGARRVAGGGPGQSLRLGSVGQLTVDGILRAPGGSIVLGEIKTGADVDAALIAAGHGRSIWLGDGAMLDAAGAP